jgi:hypothetical protein
LFVGRDTGDGSLLVVGRRIDRVQPVLIRMTASAKAAVPAQTGLLASRKSTVVWNIVMTLFWF